MVRAMSPYVPGKESAQILRRWKAEFVLINFRLPLPVTSFHASIEPDLYGPTLEKFRRDPERFREIYAKDRCHLFAFRPDAPPGEGADLPVLGGGSDRLPASARPIDALFPNGIRLGGALVEPDTIEAGGTLEVTCYWRKERESNEQLPYKVYLRLVRPGERGEGSKWKRKGIEIATGRLMRARTMRNILKGALPQSDWPAGVLLPDAIRWTVPERLEEGIYDLEVTLRRSPLIRVYYIEDFLREEDSFSGVPVGRVVVRAEAVAIERFSGLLTPEPRRGSIAAQGASTCRFRSST
jgi:hypothetical protein